MIALLKFIRKFNIMIIHEVIQIWVQIETAEKQERKKKNKTNKYCIDMRKGT